MRFTAIAMALCGGLLIAGMEIYHLFMWSGFNPFLLALGAGFLWYGIHGTAKMRREEKARDLEREKSGVSNYPY